MKKPFITILFFISLIMLEAQFYQPFAVEGAHWNMTETFCLGCDPNVNPFPYFVNDCCFKISGDTFVNGIAYKRLFESSTVTTYENAGPAGFTPGNWQEIELIREDTLARKVYFRKIAGYYNPGPDHWCG